MLPAPLQEYLAKCKAEGLTFDQVEEKLTQIGWLPDHIEQAKIWFAGSQPANPVTTPAPLPHQILSSDHSDPVVPEEVKPSAVHINPPVSAVPNAPHPRRSLGSLILVALLVVLFILSAGGVSAYLVATDRIPMKNVALKDKITDIVFQIPFIPKSPKYVLFSSTTAHEKVSKNSFDLSLAMSSNEFQSTLGMSELDIQIKGYSDFSDPKNPNFFLNTSITKDFNVDMRKKDDLMYIKVNKVPLMILAMVGADPAAINPVLENWIGIDIKPLDTEARRNLVSSPQQPDEKVQEFVRKLVDEEILPSMTMKTEAVDGIDAYRIDLNTTPEMIDRISEKIAQEYNSDALEKSEQKVSEVVKDLVITMWIGKKDYYLRKLVATFTVSPDNSTASSLPMTTPSSVAMSAAVKFADFGQDLPIEVPGRWVTPEEFYAQLMHSLPALGQFSPSSVSVVE